MYQDNQSIFEVNLLWCFDFWLFWKLAPKFPDKAFPIRDVFSVFSLQSPVIFDEPFVTVENFF